MTSKFISSLFNFVIYTTAKYNIDESHGISHSMNVLHMARNILEYECITNSGIREHERIIYASATLHDMCDKKYMDEKAGLLEIQIFLEDKMVKKEIDVVKDIISSMSYSTVKKKGFPELGEYQMAYHIVREADLMTAYDFDRSMIYHLYKSTDDIESAFHNADELFKNRVFQHNNDGLFITEYSKKYHIELQNQACFRIKNWKRILGLKKTI